MTTLVYDDFTPDVAGVTEDLVDHTPNTGGPWLKETGTGQVTCDKTHEAARMWGSNNGCRIQTGESDVKITANFTSSVVNDGTANDVALRTRMDNNELPTNCYEFRFQPSTDTVALYAYVSGTPTQVGSDAAFAFDNNAGYELFASSIGSAHILKVNGTTYISETDSSVPTNTYVGLSAKTISVNGRPAFYDFLAEDTTSPGASEVYPVSVETNQDSSWSASATTIVGDVSDENPATYVSPDALNKELILLFNPATAPGANEARIEVSYAEAQGLPGIPLNAVAAPEALSESSLALSCDSVSGATGYRFYRAPPSVASDTLLADVGTNSYLHTGVASWVQEHYKVSAYNASGEGAKSQSFSGRANDLTAPTGGSIASAEQQGTLVIFDINPATDTASGVAGYNLKNNGTLYDTLAPQEFDDETGLETPHETTISSTGATYSWTIEPFDAVGNVGTESAAFELVAISTYPAYAQGYDTDREPLEQVIWDRANGNPRGRILHTKENYDITVTHPYLTDSERQALDDFFDQNIGVLINLVLQDTGETHQCYMRRRAKFIPIAYDGTDHSFKAVVEFIQ